MKFKKLLYIPLALLLSITISSCSYIENFLNSNGILNPTNDNTNTNSNTTTNTYQNNQTTTPVNPEITYKIIWKNGDTILKTLENVKASNIPAYDGDTPTKAEDEKYQYEFNGWDETKDEINNIITYVAKFSRISKILEEITDWGYKDLQLYENKQDLISLYDDINDACLDFYNSTENLESTHKDFGDSAGDYYIFKSDINFSQYNIDFRTASAVYKCVILDHPEYYFIDNTVLSHSIKSGGVTTSYLELVADEDYKNYSDRANYKQKIEDYKIAVKNSFTVFTTTQEKKAKAIHDYIINNAEYAFEADGTTPSTSSFAHNILGIIVNKKGVCESYAKLYKYLMNDNNIECIIVTGTGKNDSGTEGHAWNYANIDDNWYGFDVTWDDPVGNIPTLSHKYFGKVDTQFINSHIVNEAYNNLEASLEYVYKLPTLATSNL